MKLTRRRFLAACLAATGPRARAQPPISDRDASWSAVPDPVAEWRRRLAERARRGTGRAGVPEGAGAQVAEPFPWEEMGRLLRSRFRDLRRHFVFEYYPWYGTNPFVHWNQWDRRPPVDLASNTVPRLGAYDSRSARVIEQHARWIADSGAGVVNLSWWGQGDFTDRTVHTVMDVMRAHDIHVAFHLEPYGPDRIDRLPADIGYLLKEYGERRRWDCFFLHERADGSQGPVFKLFRTTLPEQIVDCHGDLQKIADFTPDRVWRRATDEVRRTFRGAFDRLTLLSDTPHARRARAAGLDGLAPYDPAYERDEWLAPALAATRDGLTFSFSVNPGLDEIGQRGLPPDSCAIPRPFLPSAPDLVWSRPEDRERARRLGEQRIAETLEWTLLLQTHPWLGNVERGFFLVYITSFNEWHEGHQFEPMKDDSALTADERAFGYHNPSDGSYRLRSLTELLHRLL